jgi:hypothetical protein
VRDRHPDGVVVREADGRDAGSERLQGADEDPVDPLTGDVISSGAGAEPGDEAVSARIFNDRFALVLRLRDGDDVRDPVEVSGIEIAPEDGRAAGGDGGPEIIELADFFRLIDAVVLVDADELDAARWHGHVGDESDADAVFEVERVAGERHHAGWPQGVAAEDGEPFIGIAFEGEGFGKDVMEVEGFRGLLSDVEAGGIDDFLEEEDIGFAEVGLGGELSDELGAGFFINVERSDAEGRRGRRGKGREGEGREEGGAEHLNSG